MITSGKPQLLAALETNTGASVVFNQEHHPHGGAFTDLQYDAKASGWSLIGAPAARSAAAGNSAGVSVAVKQGISIGAIGGECDLSVRNCLGRLAGLWIQAGLETGFLLLSVYLFHTEGATQRNKSIVRRALSIVASYGSP